MSNDYICNACNYTTNIKCNFLKHIYTSKHLSNIGKYNCTLCQKNFKTKQKLHKHLKRKYPCDLIDKPSEKSVVDNGTSITIIYKYLNYIDKMFCFNFEYNSHCIDSSTSIELIVNNINILKHRFTGYELLTNSIAISFFNFNDRNKYMFFNASDSNLLLVKCNLRFRKFEVVSETIIKYVIDLIFIYDNSLLVLQELTPDITDNIIVNLITGYNKIKKSYSNIVLNS